MQRCVLCRSRRELSNEYLFFILAKIGFDTAGNGASKVYSFIPIQTIQFHIAVPPLPREPCIEVRCTQEMFLSGVTLGGPIAVVRSAQQVGMQWNALTSVIRSSTCPLALVFWTGYPWNSQSRQLGNRSSSEFVPFVRALQSALFHFAGLNG